MKALSFIAATSTCALLSSCATPPIPTARLEWAGAYKFESITSIEFPSHLSGKHYLSKGQTLLAPGPKITSGIGRPFGIKFVLSAAPPAQQVNYRVVWFFPRTMTNPQTKQSADSSSWFSACKVNTPCLAGYHPQHDWQLLPGRWAVEIRAGNDVLLHEQFDVVFEPGQSPLVTQAPRLQW